VSPEQRSLGLFAALLALATLFETREAVLRLQHVANPATSSQTVCFAAALWLLLRPGSLPRLLGFCAVHAAMILTLLPRTPNHWVLALAIDATFLLAALRLRLGGQAVDAAGLHRVAVPLVRLEVLALYAWAVFHKLNLDFFDRDLSCATTQLFRLRHLFPFLPADAWVRVVAIWGTLAIEAAIPVLLAVRRTRVYGVALAAGFHFVLGFLYTGFSATLLAWFALFVPAAVLAEGSDAAALRRRAGAGLAAFAAVWAALWLAPGETRLSTEGLAWLLYGLFWLAALAPCLRSPGAPDPPPAFAVPHKTLLALPLLVLANGANPYLGLKNVQAFSMFSNLRTEGGASNHLLVPAASQLFDWQRDLVTIQSSSDSVLAELTEARRYIHFFSTTVHPTGHPALDGPPPRWRLPFVSLRARVAHFAREGRSGLRLRYERGGVIREVENAETDPELSGQPWLVGKLFLLRAVPEGTRGLCMW
jgi:hypothetical protein